MKEVMILSKGGSIRGVQYRRTSCEQTRINLVKEGFSLVFKGSQEEANRFLAKANHF